MKILYIAHEKNMGGATKSLVTLMKECREKGDEPYAVIPFSAGGLEEALKKEKIPYKVIFFGWWMEPSYWPAPLRLAFRFLHAIQGIAEKRIVRLAGKLGSELIHSNSSTIDIGIRVARKTGLPHVWHFREYGSLDYRLSFMKGRKKAMEYVLAGDRNKERVVFISGALKDYYPELKEMGDVIYNGISMDYCQEKEKREGEPFTFLIASNLQRAKRQNLAIEAMKLLRENISAEIKTKLIIAGASSALRDSKDYEEELRKNAEPLGDSVVFLGRVEDMPALRKGACAELVLSQSEAFGRVTVEAMLASLPVIATRGGANGELVEDGQVGLLCGDDPIEIARAMEYLVMHPEEAQSMGDRAREYARGKFPSAKNTEAVRSLYQELGK